jgi:hypothetical protein
METTKERKEEREVGGGDKEVGDPFFILEGGALDACVRR